MEKLKMSVTAIVAAVLVGCAAVPPNACAPRCAVEEMRLICAREAVATRILNVRFLDGDRTRTHSYLLFQRAGGRWYAYDPEVGTYPVQYGSDPLEVGAQLRHRSLIVACWWD